MADKTEATREDARRILREGILDMSVGKLIQMADFGLIGNVFTTDGVSFTNNMFNHIEYDEEHNMIAFSIGESEGQYGEISFFVDAITKISGCEDDENPDDYLHVDIKLENKTAVDIKIVY